jgi:uncharacterized membrane-anchored protein YitT (DUF2179 family)
MDYAIALKRTTIRKRFSAAVPIIFNLGLISGGCAIFAFGMNAILIPYHFLSGGTTGIAMVWHHYVPSINIGWLYLLLNMPLILFGWRAISLSFMLYTVYGIVFFSAIAGIIPQTAIPLDSPMVAALLAGVVCGVGGGLILRTPGSAGGLDVIAVYLKKRFGFSVGSTGFIANALSVVASMLVFSLQAGLYTLIFMFTAAKVIDHIVYGLNRKKSLLVVSNRSEAIAEALLKNRCGGVTFFKGQGGYLREEKNIIFTIAGHLEMHRIKNTILSIDPQAFIVINETREVHRYSQVTSPL